MEEKGEKEAGKGEFVREEDEVEKKMEGRLARSKEGKKGVWQEGSLEKRKRKGK